ncbi:peptidylprolyl isomerase [Ranunculus cassubicifolius]
MSSSSPQVKASQILIKHQGSRRKASWKDPEGRVIMNTTRDSAVQQIKAFKDDIIYGKAKFEDIAKTYSDCSFAKRSCYLDPIRSDIHPISESRISDISDSDLIFPKSDMSDRISDFVKSGRIGSDNQP